MFCSWLSFCFTTSLLLYLAYRHIKEYLERKHPSSQRGRILPQGYLWLVNLFISGNPSREYHAEELDWLENIESVIALSDYIHTKTVVPGPFCTWQGLVLQLGHLGSAIWMLVIAIHTFLLMACGRRCREWVTRKSGSGKARWVLVVCVWIWVVFNGIYGLLFIEPFHPELGPYCNFCECILD
jgi:hypothetical protein